MTVELVDVNAENVEKLGFYCYRSKKKKPGYTEKMTWIQARFDEGMRVRLLYLDGKLCGMVEAVPGTHAWRAVHAPNHLVIHCMYVMGRYQGQGYGVRLIESCLDDARQLDLAGVAVVVGENSILPDRGPFDRAGFTAIDQTPDGFELLALPVNGGSGETAHFPTDWEARAAQWDTGLVTMHSPQCPYQADSIDAVAAFGADRGIPTQAVELTSAADVQTRAPSPYGVFSVLHEGRVIAHRPVDQRDLQRLLP